MQPSHESPRASKAAKSLIFTSAITFVYFLVELFGGIFTGSLALIADSSHMAGDFLSLAFAWFATQLARRTANLVKTYGYHRVEVLAGLINAMALWIIAGMILANAMKRFGGGHVVLAGPMTVIAAFGLLVNIACLLILKKESKKNLNVRGAYIHVLSDMLGSIGAIAGGIYMRITGNYLADPIISGFICILIIISSLRLMLNSLNILLEGVPPHLNIKEIRTSLLGVPGVKDIHDLHVWSLGTQMDMLTGHILIASSHTKKIAAVLLEAGLRLRERFGIEHTTLQPETDSD